jgi:hypothetical protein
MKINKKSIKSIYKKFVKKHKRNPSSADLNKLDVSRDMIRHHFGNMTNLKDEMREENPSLFSKIIDETLFEPQRFKKIEEEVGSYKRFVITTAVTGCDVHDKFYASLKNYCKRNDALLLILPCKDPAANVGWSFDSKLSEEFFVGSDLTLNKNMHIRMIQLSAKQIKPTTGLQRLSQKDGGFIYASPKQFLEYVPVSGQKLPHPIMTTGAITKPNYDTDRHMSKRTAYIAEFDHVMGAIIIELDTNANYYFRQIQAEPKTGNFVDLGKYYKNNGSVEKMAPEAFVLGDYHAGEHDPQAKQVWKEVIELTGAKNIIGHDVYNGKSVSHHDQHKKVTKARKALQDQLSLEDELEITAKEVNDMCDWISGKFIWVKSNHDEVLDRYLEEGRYVEDELNLRLASQLVKPMVDGQDPLEYALTNLGDLTSGPFSKKTRNSLKSPEKVQFLKRDEDFKVAGIELSSHGDKGPNGSKGSMQAFETSYGACVVGHSHSPAILRHVWRVGTTSLLRLDYNVGASSWMHSSCLVYPNGSRQMINSIRGRWRLK